MTLVPGARLGPYQIESAIGVGGMGEVYKARDTRLDRSVAIKVLPPEVSADPERRARFEREAKTIAGLNHPHICTLHDVGSTGSPQAPSEPPVLYLVMELLTGETLAARLEKGPLPLDQALTVATEIADALSAAHRQGVIHRDLKPGNVMLTKAGAARHGSPQAKLLDFGLAKLTGHGERAAAAHLVSAPTRSTPLTGEGMIAGTLQYMAPEQLEGRPADARTDLWALGAILYEMLTGRRAFEGTSAASLITAIMGAEPPALPALQPLTPPAVDRLVRRCLAKAPDDRPDTAHDVASELRWLRESSDAGVATPGGRGRAGARRTLLLIAAAVLLVAVGLGIGSLLGPSPPPLLVTRVSLDVRPADALSGSNPLESLKRRPSRTAIALAPDGRLLVVSASKGREQQLYARHLDRDDASPIKGSEGGEMPFFSPDGRWIGFWADGVLRKIPVAGGPAVEICRTSQPTGASWCADSAIVFSRDAGGLWQVPDDGRTAKPLTTLDATTGEWSHRLPHALPGGRGVLYTSVSTRDPSGWTAMVLVAATGERKVLLERAADARYVPTGHLLFIREGKLLAVPFDLATLRVTAGETAIADEVMQALNVGHSAVDTGAAQVAVADSGVLAYVRGGIAPDWRYSLGILETDGAIRRLPSEPEPHPYLAPQLSPDGQRVVTFNSSTLSQSLWVYDIGRGFLSRPVVGLQAQFPIWTPDGRSIVFAGSEKGRLNLFRVSADRAATPERLTRSPFTQLPACWGRGGSELVFLESHSETGYDIMAMPIGAPQTTRPLLQTRFSETYPAVSPDGRWLAYTSDELGREEVYVQPYTGEGETIRVSADGGSNPLWSRDGCRLFFYSSSADLGTLSVYSAETAAMDRVAAARPRLLFHMADPLSKVMGAEPLHGWDLMPDGKSFLVVTAAREQPVFVAPKQVELVLNWFEELKAKAPRQ